VNKVLVEQDSPEPKVKVFIPMYLPLQASKCEKCGEVIAQPKELIKIVKSGSGKHLSFKCFWQLRHFGYLFRFC
jgi:hypothetical protein